MQPPTLDRLFVVIPCYNDFPTIGSTIASLLPYAGHIVVVDDGSQPSLISHVHHLPVYYLRHIVNLGQGAALRTGTDFALQNGAEWIVHFDADGQHSAEDVLKMLAPLHKNSVDIVLGSRFLNPVDIQAIPLFKRFLLQLGRIVNRILAANMRLSDAHNGFRAMNRQAALVLEWKSPRMAHASEILTDITRHKLRYCEVPTHVKYTPYSRKKGQKWYHAIDIVWDLVLNKR